MSMFPKRVLCCGDVDIVLAKVMAVGEVGTAEDHGAWFTVFGSMPLVLSFSSPFAAYKAREELLDALKMMPERLAA